MNLLKELQIVAKENAAKLSKEQDKILDAVKNNLQQETNEDLEMLQYFGTKNVIAKAVENKEVSKQYSTGEYLTMKDIGKVCVKYDLKFLSASIYKNEIPLKALNDLKKFKETAPESKHFNFVKPKPYSIKGMMGGDYNITQEIIDGDGENSYYFDKNKLMIIAPSSHFNSVDRPKKDPVLVYRTSGSWHSSDASYKIVSTWGNDFTFMRRIKGIIKNNIFGIYLLLQAVLFFIVSQKTKLFINDNKEFSIATFCLALLVFNVVAIMIHGFLWELILQRDSFKFFKNNTWNTPKYN